MEVTNCDDPSKWHGHTVHKDGGYEACIYMQHSTWCVTRWRPGFPMVTAGIRDETDTHFLLRVTLNAEPLEALSLLPFVLHDVCIHCPSLPSGDRSALQLAQRDFAAAVDAEGDR